VQTAVRPALRLTAANVVGSPGQTITVPITADVSGGYPLRGLMLGVEVEALDGAPAAGQIDFVPGALGSPTSVTKRQAGRLGAIWLNTDVDGLLGQGTIGAIVFSIPANAAPTAIYRVRFEHVSGSPNGITRFPVSRADGVVSMANRPDSPWADEIGDGWRAQYFGSASAPLSHPLLDPDGDGVNNLAEFKLGSNPLDREDNLRVRASARARSLSLQFRTALGRKYILEASETLEPGSWRVVRPEIVGNGAAFEHADESTAARLYYRLRLKE
jgi:hypothetical protein